MRNLTVILFALFITNIKSLQILQFSNFLETAFNFNPAISSMGNNFIGLSVKQLFENNWNTLLNSDLSKNKSSLIITEGKKFKASEFIFSPTIMTTFTSEIIPVFLLGFQFECKEFFGFGLYIKNENLFTSQIKINISKKLQVSYAHDLLISTFSNRALYSDELMIFLIILCVKNQS